METTYKTAYGDTLGAIAKKNKTDVATLAKLNNISDPNKLGTGVVLKIPGVNTASTTAISYTSASPVNSNVLASGGKNVTVPPPVNNTSAQNNLAITGNKVVNTPAPAPYVPPAPVVQAPAPITSMSQVTDAKTAAQYLGSLIGIQGTKGDYTASAQKEVDLAGKTQALTDLNSKALTTKKSYEDQIKKMRENSDGKLTGALDAEISDLTRKANEDLANIGIQQQVAQGNLTAAQTIIKDKVDAKFEPIDNQISSLEKLYTLYQNDMSESDQVEAQLKIDELKTKRDQNSTAYAKALETAVQNGAPDSVLKAIDTAASNPNASASSIYAAAGQYAVQPSDSKYQLQQDARGGFVVFDPATGMVTPIGSTTGDTSGINEDAVSLASIYASTGTPPSPTELKFAGTTLSAVQDIAKSLPKVDGALVDRNTGLKPTSLSAAQEEGITSLSEIVRMTLPRLEEIYPKLITGGALNPFTTQNRQEYNTFKDEFLSKLLVARSGAAVTEQEFARYKALLPDGLDQLTGAGKKKLASLASSMKTTLDNKLDTNQMGIVGYTKVKLTGDPENKDYVVGATIELNGQRARVNVDGSLTELDTGNFNSAGNASVSKVSIPQTSRLAYVNNNPGNLRFAGQTGAVKGEGGFAKFPSPAAGLTALVNQIKLDASRGLSLSSFINKYAPPSENDTSGYLQQVASMLGVSPNTAIKDVDINKLTAAIARKESSTIIG